MPTGIIINTLSVFLGGIIGALCGSVFSDKLKEGLTMLFGLCAMCMGIMSVVLMKNMPAVILSAVLGLIIGNAAGISKAFDKAGAFLGRFMPSKGGEASSRDLITIALVLFCFGSTGIYGAMCSGFAGDHSILISKSVLDLFTAMIFASAAGYAISAVCVPQFAFLMICFGISRFILPFATDIMIADFKACGGLIMIATGLKMMKIREFPIPDMIPAIFIVMPLSALYTNVISPLLLG